MPPPQRSYSTAALLLCAASAAADVVLDGGAGLKWLVMSAGPSTYALGQPFLNRQPLDNAPVDDGIAFWRRMSDELVIPVLASSITVDASGAAATLSGSATLPSGGPGGGATDTAVAVRVALDGAFTAATLSVSFSSEAGVAKNEWQLCVKWAHDGESADEWRAQGYPIAANASRVDNARLEYVTLRHLKMRLDSPSLRPPPPPPPTPHPLPQPPIPHHHHNHHQLHGVARASSLSPKRLGRRVVRRFSARGLLEPEHVDRRYGLHLQLRERLPRGAPVLARRGRP